MQISRNKLLNTLINAGFSEKEAQVYLTSMALGPSSVSNISKSSGIKRTTVYSVFEMLKLKGLMREEIKGWKSFYVAESPEKLESIIDQMKSEIRKNMPEFTSMYNLHSSGAFIKYYEGMEAIRGVYNELLKEIKAHEDYLVIGELKQWMSQDPDFFMDFIKRRAKLNINIRILLQDSDIAREHKKIEKNFNENIKMMAADMKLTTNMVIVPNKVVINQLTPPYLAMIVENESIVQMNRELFEVIWRSLPN